MQRKEKKKARGSPYHGYGAPGQGHPNNMRAVRYCEDRECHETREKEDEVGGDGEHVSRVPPDRVRFSGGQHVVKPLRLLSRPILRGMGGHHNGDLSNQNQNKIIEKRVYCSQRDDDVRFIRLVIASWARPRSHPKVGRLIYLGIFMSWICAT